MTVPTTDPFAAQAAPAPVAPPFGAPSVPSQAPAAPATMSDPFALMDDPFAPLAGGGSIIAPRIADLDGRLLAMRIRRLEDRPKYQAKDVADTAPTGIVDFAVLDGGTIYAPPEKDAPFGSPMRECGEAPMLFKGRFVSPKGILNRFPVVRNRFSAIPAVLGAPIDFSSPRDAVILGRLGRIAGNKDVAKHLGLSDSPTEADLVKVQQWLATNPPQPSVDKANLFRTLVPVTPEAHAVAVAWVRENPEFLA
jgi:hypothetical protein